MTDRTMIAVIALDEGLWVGLTVVVVDVVDDVVEDVVDDDVVELDVAFVVGSGRSSNWGLNFSWYLVKSVKFLILIIGLC